MHAVIKSIILEDKNTLNEFKCTKKYKTIAEIKISIICNLFTDLVCCKFSFLHISPP